MAGKANHPDLLFENLGPVFDTTPEQKRAARLTVCRHSDGPQDARALLEMLGLLGEEEDVA